MSKKHNSLDIDEKQEKCSTVQLDVTHFTSKCVFIVNSFKKILLQFEGV